MITNASPIGIGAAIEQDGRPVIFIARVLNRAEQGYSQTQKEAFVIGWAVKRVHNYLFGLHFTIVTDRQA